MSLQQCTVAYGCWCFEHLSMYCQRMHFHEATVKVTELIMRLQLKYRTNYSRLWTAYQTGACSGNLQKIKHHEFVVSRCYTASRMVSFHGPTACSPHVCTDINGQLSKPFSERSLGLLDSSSVSVPK